jgi:cell division protein FtsI/penicillin-binding protein 2
MGRTIQFRRLFALTVFLATVLALLSYRLVYLQVLRHDELQVKAQRNTQRNFVRQPLRGQIRDIRGTLLATSVPAKTVCVDPTLIGPRGIEVARVLAPLLETNETFLVDRFTPRFMKRDDKIVPVQYCVLKRKVPMETWDRIQAAMEGLNFGLEEKKLPRKEQAFYRNLRQKAVFAEEDQIRFYPNQSLAAHVVGYVANDDDQTGLSGIESVLNSKLAGVRGWLRTELDNRHRELIEYRQQDVDPRDGVNVVLTLDARLQQILEEEMAQAMQKLTPTSITGVIMRPKTGEILAMAALPTYDPNRPGLYSPDSLRNRVIADVMEPGSTFKIVVVSGALNDHLVSLRDSFDCEHGRFMFAGRTLHDHESYGVLDVERIITKSSNIGAAKIGIRLGESKLYQYIRDFGFGSFTGVPLPGEVRGIVHPVNKWSKVSIAQIPMGHGVAVTPMQMALAMCTIANQGVMMRPMLIDRLEDADGRVLAKFQPQPARRVITEEAARNMIEALKTVAGPDGTAPKARMDNFTVAGKTGTAQKVMPGGLRYYTDRYFSSFIGFFPADNAELCVAISMDDPRGSHYGGQTSAPVFKRVAERAAHYLNITPDIAPEALKEALAVAQPKTPGANP